jgi:hypothetical protein
MNKHAPEDLFDLMSRWDDESRNIPAYLLSRGASLPASDRKSLLVRHAILKRLVVELRDALAGMAVRYRGIVNGEVIIESEHEEDCWARVGDEGTVEFTLLTKWLPTDSAIAHDK